MRCTWGREMGDLCSLSCAGWRWGWCLGPASAPSFGKAPSHKEMLSWSRRFNSVLHLFSQFARVQLSLCARSPHPTESVGSWGYKPWAPGASGHLSPTGGKNKSKKQSPGPTLVSCCPKRAPYQEATALLPAGELMFPTSRWISLWSRTPAKEWIALTAC